MDGQITIENISGLSAAEAKARLLTIGTNELPTDGEHTFLAYIWKVVSEPMFALLIIGAILYFILGGKTESMMLLGFVLVIMAITFYQQRKSEHALQALHNLSSPRAFVIRDGKGMRIAGREVVPGDIMVVSEGDCVAADAELISSTNLLIDEAILTGESVSVQKGLSDAASIIYSGTSVVQGKGIARVTATGKNTEIGKIGTCLKKVKTERTQLQKDTDLLVKNFAIWGMFVCVIIVIIFGLTRGNWLQGLLVGIALAMSVLPEELPVILTVFLAIGAWRISLKRVLTRRVPVVEALGAATVLCVDKTGTLTQNRMSVCEIFANGENFSLSDSIDQLPETFHELIEYSILASQRDPFDPMEIAIKKLGEHYLEHTEHLHKHWDLVQQYTLSKKLLAMSLVWQSSDKKDYVIAAKGAPESIFDLCHLDHKKIIELQKQAQAMAARGLRILGVAKAHFAHSNHLPETQHDFNFEFVGLVGLADPVRENAAEAIANCYNAGIRVIMLTGDYAATAQNIAQQIGLKDIDAVISGSELALMNDMELAQKIKNVNIFARIMPEQKLRIVEALKANGEIVAMTGDGVNDAPALKAAEIGIAMGARGSDVAREASALVLLDDDFASIVSAIRLGRRIFDNIKKAITYTIAVHIPIIGVTLMAVLFKLPLMLFPMHIVFLELIIDPTCSIVFEGEHEEPNIMRRAPRDTKESLLKSRIVIKGLLQGLGVFIMVACALIFLRHTGLIETQIRAIIFALLVVSNLGLIFINRSLASPMRAMFDGHNQALWWVVTCALGFLGIILFVPFFRGLFYFAI